MERIFYRLFLRVVKLLLDLRQFLFMCLFFNRCKENVVRADLRFLDLRGAYLTAPLVTAQQLTATVLHGTTMPDGSVHE